MALDTTRTLPQRGLNSTSVAASSTYLVPADGGLSCVLVRSSGQLRVRVGTVSGLRSRPRVVVLRYYASIISLKRMAPFVCVLISRLLMRDKLTSPLRSPCVTTSRHRVCAGPRGSGLILCRRLGRLGSTRQPRYLARLQISPLVRGGARLARLAPSPIVIAAAVAAG